MSRLEKWLAQAQVSGRQDTVVNVVRHPRILIPVAALVSADDLEHLRRFEEQRKKDFAVLDRMREAFKDVPMEEIEREIARAVAEVRTQKRANGSDAPPHP